MKTIRYNIIFITILLFVSCKKYLDARPDNSMAVPTEIQDLQAILDNDNKLNGSINNGYSSSTDLGFIGAEDFYIPDAYNSLLPIYGQNAFTWKNGIYTTTPVDDWSGPYFGVSYANTAIMGLNSISKNTSNMSSWNNLRGIALFFRSFYFFQLAEIFAPPYDSITAKASLGIPLRLGNDINEKIQRSNLQETYERIIDDLNEAATILPDFPSVKTRPSKTAAYALLARVYLSMGNYAMAKKNANKCLEIKPYLLDYNLLDTNASAPFASYNGETIFYSLLNYAAKDLGFLVNAPRIRVDSAIFASYNENDLRKTLYFVAQNPNGYKFRGSYSGSKYFFNGLAYDEVYLIKAECNARLGSKDEALNDLNLLLKTRWKSGTYNDLSVGQSADVLQVILSERRKELIFRGLRWSDLRRLNNEGANFIQTRVFNGATYTLPPNDNRYVYPIPPEVIGFNPDMPQNPR